MKGTSKLVAGKNQKFPPAYERNLRCVKPDKGKRVFSIKLWRMPLADITLKPFSSVVFFVAWKNPWKHFLLWFFSSCSDTKLTPRHAAILAGERSVLSGCWCGELFCPLREWKYKGNWLLIEELFHRRRGGTAHTVTDLLLETPPYPGWCSVFKRHASPPKQSYTLIILLVLLLKAEKKCFN